MTSKGGWIAPALLLLGCASTVPRDEHDRALEKQQASYEDRLRRVEEERLRLVKEREAEREAAARGGQVTAERVHELETALTDKERMLDEVSSQLVGLQDAFAALSGTERQRAEARLERERQVKSALGAAGDALKEGAAEAAAKGKLEVVSADEALTVRVKDGWLFLKGSSRLLPQGRPLLERLAKVLAAGSELHLTVAAHTDAVRSAGGEQEPLNLSFAQAAAILKELSAKGVDPSRVRVAPFGATAPLASNDTDAGREQNRRVELVLSLRGSRR